MILGEIGEDEKRVKFNVPIHCTECKRSVPGRIISGEEYSQTKAFEIELEHFKKNYLCGICRDKRRRK
ncbi:hypothetical protein C5F49_03930 [Nitrosopumilus oxyclinae]|uniref:Uncharacterized protein n=1 Tax=Nitrosopumilus oxyclinae TaxID=1959104 RepID=A0A7D5R4N8_9ARCH|nr:hypothetical protein [Nitrosopumilus oxyclinae]QLH04559.1 hypothetical protein C5F49_03930 [Nitrosopumilus oxyclinae]